LLPTIPFLKKRLGAIINCECTQGHFIDDLQAELSKLPDSYDAISSFAERIAASPMRSDWPYVEPNDLADILRECDPARPLGQISAIDPEIAERCAETAFLASVAGCMLGKPLEEDLTLSEIRQAAQAVGEWPLNDYISEALLDKLGHRHPSWNETTRGRIQYVAPDDDMNYSILGMMLLEAHGSDFTTQDVMNAWLHNLTPLWTWGPERTILIKAAIHSIDAKSGPSQEIPFETWVNHWNPESEACGAAIRVDAYGFACPGNPALAAELAWRDSHWTHRRTGIYAAMFIAAAIASAFVIKDPLTIFETALQFVPHRSRFYEVIVNSIRMVGESKDWLDGYERIHAKYGQYTHCQIYQEAATVINTLHFANNVGEGICMQVGQGNDTDCFGKIAGSLLGALYGPGSLERHWTEPFNDEIHVALANFYEHSLSGLAKRMGRLVHIGLDKINRREFA
jgi:ADP-ribosylglycohydrolase